MSLAQSILEEFERACPLTRTHLERIPADKLDWRPAPKSMTIGQLGLHIAQSSGGAAEMAASDTFELPDFEFAQPASVAEILEAYDHSAEQVRHALTGLSDERMLGMLSFTKDGAELFSFPRHQFMRDILLSHMYHHRGQMSVYLRELDVPVPSSFGPTADEPVPGMPEPANA